MALQIAAIRFADPAPTKVSIPTAGRQMGKLPNTFTEEKPEHPVTFKLALTEEDKWAIGLIVLWLFIFVWAEYLPNLFYF